METSDAGVGMTDSAIIAASYAAERNYSHNPDDVIDASGAVLAIGTEKVNTTTLKDISLTGNDATIHGAMPTEGFIQGRRFDGDDDYLDCGNAQLAGITGDMYLECLVLFRKQEAQECVSTRTGKNDFTVPYTLHYNGGTMSFYVGSGISRYAGKYSGITLNKYYHVIGVIDGNNIKIYVNGVLGGTAETFEGSRQTGTKFTIGSADNVGSRVVDGIILFTQVKTSSVQIAEVHQQFNTLARLPFWSVNYTDYPDNVTEYTDNLPYSSSIISSGTFKVNDNKLQCVSAGTMTYSASYAFDGSEYIKVTIDGVEYDGTGTITQGNTTVSVAQGSNKITIQAGTGDTIDKIDIQFREEV